MRFWIISEKRKKLKIKKRKRLSLRSLFRPQRVISASVVLSCLVLSCTTHSEGGSITSLLDMADQSISIGDTRQAMSYLSQATKQAGTPLDRLGIFKRYETLGDAKMGGKDNQDSHKERPFIY